MSRLFTGVAQVQDKESVARLNAIRVIGPVPSSIAYIHVLAASGQGDCYDWNQGTVTVNLCHIDRVKEPSLETVASITLEYEKRSVQRPESQGMLL